MWTRGTLTCLYLQRCCCKGDWQLHQHMPSGELRKDRQRDTLACVTEGNVFHINSAPYVHWRHISAFIWVTVPYNPVQTGVNNVQYHNKPRLHLCRGELTGGRVHSNLGCFDCRSYIGGCTTYIAHIQKASQHEIQRWHKLLGIGHHILCEARD